MELRESILNIEVSCFTNYDTPANPKPVNLLSWLTSKKYAHKVNGIRAMDDKAKRAELKALLPAITPSGIFTYRSASNLVKHSGFIQFDIDLKGNENIMNYQQLKAQIQNIQNVAYAGLSVSGTGYWGLIPIKFPDKHLAHFLALQKDFASVGITIDPARKDIAGLRGYSYDNEPYFNHNAVTYYKVFEPPKPKPVQHSKNCKILSDEREIFRRIQVRRKNTGDVYADGNKHIFLYSMASSCNHYGLDEHTTSELLKEHYLHAGSYVKPENYDTIVKDAYKRFATQHNTASFELSTFKPRTTGYKHEYPRRKELPRGYHYETFVRFDGVECQNVINADGYPQSWDN